jgi:CRISPR-associated Cas5-like protein
LKVIISAPLGHFQRPGNPGEPSTYPIITPTAVEGIINAVYWHPGQSVQVKSISILNPIAYTTETLTQLNHQTGSPWLRTYELLVEPKYLVDFWLDCDPGIDCNKRIGLLARRLLGGQHYYQPCMGISDYPATVELLAKDAISPQPIEIKEMGLGRMPHYWSWESSSKPTKKTFARRTTAMLTDRPLERAVGAAVMFEAKIVNGRITIPAYPRRGEGGYAD